jgi:hypothetical protein
MCEISEFGGKSGRVVAVVEDVQDCLLVGFALRGWNSRISQGPIHTRSRATMHASHYWQAQ